MYRTSILAILLLVCCCSSPQETAETTTEGQDDQAATTTPTGETTPPRQGESPPASGDGGDCDGEPWSAAYPHQENDFPPDRYLSCTADSECTEREQNLCCGDKTYAVAVRFSHCIAERSSGANCRAHCMQTAPGVTASMRTPSCVEGSCRLVLEDGSAHRAVHLPWNPGK